MFRTVKSGLRFAVVLLSAQLAGLAAWVGVADAVEPLRVCADPDNLPFTKSDGPERGMYIELAEMVGKKIGKPIEYTWYLTFNQRRALRNTVLQDGCDAVFALPAGSEYKARGLDRTEPFLAVGYAVVADSKFKFSSLDDLRPLKLAVQMMSTPHIVLSTIDGFKMSSFRSAEDALAALAGGEVDAAFLWGPVAGYHNKRNYASRWKVTPVSGHDFFGHVAVAVRKGKDELKADIDRALLELKPEIDALAEKYGFPREKPLELSADESPAPAQLARAVQLPAEAIQFIADATQTSSDKPRKKKKKPAAEQAAPAAAESVPVAPSSPVPSAEELSPQAQAGRVRFNDTCSHCHGSDGASPIRERDLRRLNSRYGDKWRDTALTTIKEGRVPLGMPTWQDILKEDQIEEILAFLKSMQR